MFLIVPNAMHWPLALNGWRINDWLGASNLRGDFTSSCCFLSCCCCAAALQWAATWGPRAYEPGRQKWGALAAWRAKKLAIASGKREKGTSIFNFSLPNPKPGGLVTNDTLHMHDAMKKTMKLHVNFGCNAERRERGACVCSLLATERLSTGSERSRGCGSSSIIIYIICRHASKANLS